MNLANFLARSVRALDTVIAGGSEYFVLDQAQQEVVAKLITRSINHNDPRRQRPPFSPQKQLNIDGFDRIAAMQGRIDSMLVSNEVRSAISSELIVLLSLLDHHPHSEWRFRTRTGAVIRGEDAIQVAMYRMFVMGHFSLDRLELRVDAGGLATVDLAMVHEALHGDPALTARSAEFIVDRCHGLAEVLHRSPHTRLAEQFDWHSPPLASKTIHTLLPLFSQAKVSEARALTMAVGCAHALQATFVSCGMAFEDPQNLPPVVTDRVTGLYLDAGLLKLTEAGTRALRSSEAEFVRDELQWVAFALTDSLLASAKSLETRSADSLTHTAMAQSGTVPAGRAIALLRRPDGAPPISFSL